MEKEMNDAALQATGLRPAPQLGAKQSRLCGRSGRAAAQPTVSTKWCAGSGSGKTEIGRGVATVVIAAQAGIHLDLALPLTAKSKMDSRLRGNDVKGKACRRVAKHAELKHRENQ
jgi:hypothetical protein